MASTTPVNPTGDDRIDGILNDDVWSSRFITYSFPDSTTNYGKEYGWGETQNNFRALTDKQKDSARAAFDMYSSVSKLSFVEVGETDTQHATIRLANSDEPDTAWAYSPGTDQNHGDVWFGNDLDAFLQDMGTYAFETTMHEIGHALGLKHAHEGDPQVPEEYDSSEFSIMSYRSFVGADTDAGRNNEMSGYAQSLMMLDIAAIQSVYGANYETNSDDTTYTWSETTGEMSINGEGQGTPRENRIFRTVWDGGGVDTYDFSNYDTDLRVDLRPGEWTTTSFDQLAKLDEDGAELARGNIANALLHDDDSRSPIENAEGGSGNDLVIGNRTDNALLGNDGDDRLVGKAGNDMLIGGRGKDTLEGGEGLDTASYAGAEAGVTASLADSTENSGEADGDTYKDVEGLAGSNFSDRLVGDEGDNELFGAAGSDVLEGGLGADVLNGGNGYDTASYAGASSGVTVKLHDTSGNEGAAAGDEYTSIEWLTGSSHDDKLAGDSNGNGLRGGAGEDYLYGKAGDDWLSGDAGKDWLYGNEGSDLLFGGDGVDTLIGGEGHDVLEGGGGADWMAGEAGSDMFTFRDASDFAENEEESILDFDTQEDILDLSRVDADQTQEGNQAFSLIGDQEFSGEAGELCYSDGVLSGDMAGDGVADFEILLLNDAQLTQNNIIV